jgi:predicted Zn finger-like uncharacterized protein
MEITCEHCGAKLNIPDEKIPKDQIVKIGCPKCKNKITLDTHSRASANGVETGPEEGAGSGSVGSKPEKESEEGYTYSDYSEDKALDFYDEGAKLSLIMCDDPEQSRKVHSIVKELGYQGVVSPDARDALGKMRFQHFDMIVLCDGFDGQSLEDSPVLSHLNRLPMAIRRRIFLALLGEKFKSKDNMMSFAMSANAVFNTKELDRLAAMLKKAISDNEKLYKVFMDTLAHLGRA